MQDNARIYRMIRLLRLQVKNSRSNPSSQTHFALETLAKAVVILQNPEAIQDAADFSNIGKAEEVSKKSTTKLKRMKWRGE